MVNAVSISVGENPILSDDDKCEVKFGDGELYVEQDYLFPYVRDTVVNARELIKSNNGNLLYQSYLAGISETLDWDMNRFLDLFLDHSQPEGVFPDDCMDTIMKETLFDYAWEIKHFMKKSGCDRNKNFNHSRSIIDGGSVRTHYPCGSVLCPTCNNELVLKRKKSISTYAMNVPHTQFTFTVDRERWDRIGWDNMGDLYRAVEIAVKNAFMRCYGLEVGAIANLHTFSSLTLHWQPHIDVFVSLMGFDRDGKLFGANRWHKKPDVVKYVDKELLHNMREIFTKEIIDCVGGGTPNTDDGMFWVHQNTNKNGEIVRKPLLNVSDKHIVGGLLGDTMRYFKRLPLSDDNIIDVNDETVIFTTDKRKKDGLDPIELTHKDYYSRVGQHIAPPNFRIMRPFGVYGYCHKHHDTAKYQYGYKLDDDRVNIQRDTLRRIGYVVFDEICKVAEGLDPTITLSDDDVDDKTPNKEYLDTFMSVVDRVEKRLLSEGVFCGEREGLIRVVQCLIDCSCKTVDKMYLDGVEYEDVAKPVLNAEELRELMRYSRKKLIERKEELLNFIRSVQSGVDKLVRDDVCERERVELQQIKDILTIQRKITVKTYSGLSNPLVNADGEICLWVGLHSGNRYVNKSRLAMAIFNTYDFKEKFSSLWSLIDDTNRYYSMLQPHGCDGFG